MAGLLQRAAGGAMAGLGQGIVANAAALREERLAHLRARYADRRNQQAIDARAEEGRLGREHTAGENEKSRTAAAEQGQLDRDAAETRARIAAGARGKKNPPRLYVMSEDPLTGKKTYGTREQALGEAGAAEAQVRTAEVDEAADDMTGWWPEFLGGKRDPSDAERTRAYDIARKNPEMTGKEALMRAMGMGGRGDEPGQGGETTPTGAGSASDPYEVTSQAHVDWLKANAKPGSVYRHNGQTFRVK